MPHTPAAGERGHLAADAADDAAKAAAERATSPAMDESPGTLFFPPGERIVDQEGFDSAADEEPLHPDVFAQQ